MFLFKSKLITYYIILFWLLCMFPWTFLFDQYIATHFQISRVMYWDSNIKIYIVVWFSLLVNICFVTKYIKHSPDILSMFIHVSDHASFFISIILTSLISTVPLGALNRRIEMKRWVFTIVHISSVPFPGVSISFHHFRQLFDGNGWKLMDSINSDGILMEFDRKLQTNGKISINVCLLEKNPSIPSTKLMIDGKCWWKLMENWWRIISWWNFGGILIEKQNLMETDGKLIENHGGKKLAHEVWWNWWNLDGILDLENFLDGKL